MAKFVGRTRTYTVRPAIDSDSADVICLIDSVFSEYPGVILLVDEELPDLNAPHSSFIEKGGAFFVVEYEKKIVASAAFTFNYQTKYAELYRLYVAKCHRKEGLAQYLLGFIERIVSGKDAQVVELWTDCCFLDAHRFYKQNQYVQSQGTRALNDVSGTIEFHFFKKL
jgi:GNAT superfamily N-acetyltransferase